MAATLKRLGFQVLEGIDLDKRAMERIIRQFDVTLAGADLSFFYYAGHGIQVSGQNYLIPVDARLAAEGDIDFESLPLTLILRRMERETKTALVLLDACRDNPLVRNLSRTMGTRGGQVSQGLSEVKAGIGTLIGYSTQPGNVALDGEGRNSPYTAALLQEIETPGRDVLAMLAAVRGAVLKATQGRQVPWEHTSLVGPVVLKVAATSHQQSLGPTAAAAEWSDVKDTSNIEALRGYIGRYKDDPVYAPLARDRLDTLVRQQKAVMDKANADRITAEQRKKEEAEKSEKKRIVATTEAKQRADQEQARAELEAKRKMDETRQAGLPSNPAQPTARLDDQNRQQVKAATEKAPTTPPKETPQESTPWATKQGWKSCRSVYVNCKYTWKRENCDPNYSACKVSGCWIEKPRTSGTYSAISGWQLCGLTKS